MTVKWNVSVIIRSGLIRRNRNGYFFIAVVGFFSYTDQPAALVAASRSFQFCTIVAQLSFRESLIIIVGVSTCDLDSSKVVAGHVLCSGSGRPDAGSGLEGLHCHLRGGAGGHNCWPQPQIPHLQQKLVEMRNGCGTCKLHYYI